MVVTENKGKTALAADFSVTEEMRRWAWSACKGLNIEDVTAEFVDYARGRDWRMKDWQATWRNWCRKAMKANAGKSFHAAPQNSTARVLPAVIEPPPAMSEGRHFVCTWYMSRCARAGGFDATKDETDKLRQRAFELADQFDLLRSEKDPEATRERLYEHLDRKLEKWNEWRMKRREVA